MDSATSVERQLYILSLLSQSPKGYTLGEIIDNLRKVGIDATRRMVSRDMDSISRDFFVYEDEVDGKTVYKADKYAVANMDFTMPQIISLHYIKELLMSGNDSGLSKDARGIIDGILDQMPKLSKAALSEVEKMIKVVPLGGNGGEDIDTAIFEDIRTAMGECKSINMTYATFSTGEVTERLFDPYVLEVREGYWHVIGYCHLRGSVRDFRVSRIKRTELTESVFEVPHDFYEQYRGTRFDKLAGQEIYDICVEFNGDAAKLVKEYHAHKADEIIEDGENIKFLKRTALTPDLVQWLLSFGAEARVEYPSKLADRILEIARNIEKRYKGAT